jgi:hypothetical protein
LTKFEKGFTNAKANEDQMQNTKGLNSKHKKIKCKTKKD